MSKEELKKYRYNQAWIRSRIEHLEEYRENIMKITTTLSDMPNGSSKVNDKIAEKIAILLDDIDDILKYTLEEEKKLRKIIEQLNEVEQPYRLILEKYYIQGKPLTMVATEMNYSYEHIKRMNGIALLRFEKVATKCY